MKTHLFLSLLISLIISPLTAEESLPGIPKPSSNKDTLYKNSVEINPTSEGYYLGYERLIPVGNNVIVFFDAKNTAESGDDFGRSGLSCRYSFRDKSLFSARLETAWIDGQHNIGTRLGFDNRLFGVSVTGIKSLSDPVIERTEEIVTAEDSSYQDTYSQTRGNYDVYDRATTTTQTILVKETRFATPDGVMIDINLNIFKFCNFSMGWSHWESDNWKEDGLQSQLSWQFTATDSIGGHYARVDDNEEGGVYYKKRFNSMKDIFKRGDPVEPGTDLPLLHRFANVPFSTPPIRLITAQSYVEKRIETRVNTTHDEILVSRGDSSQEKTVNPASPSNLPPIIASFGVTSPFQGEMQVTTLSASDSDGNIVTWILSSNKDGVLASGSWPMAVPSPIYLLSGGIHNITITLIDNQGSSTTSTQSINVF